MAISELTTVNRTSVVDSAYEVLQAQILNGTLAPGEKLPTESELTKALGVSRSTLREALNRLASARLIRIQHGGSKTVLDYRQHGGLELLTALIASHDGTINVDLVRSALEMRDCIAPDAASLAAKRRTNEQAKQLISIANRLCDNQVPLADLVGPTMDFWRLVVAASHNVAYQLAYNSLMVTEMGDINVMRQTIEAELRAGELYLDLAKAIHRRHYKKSIELSTQLVKRGSDGINAAIELYLKMQSLNQPGEPS